MTSRALSLRYERVAAVEKAARAARVAALEAEAKRIAADRATLDALRDDGFVSLRGAIDAELVRAARREINRELGAAQTTDAFKNKTFASHPAILALVKDSVVPLLLAELLGGDAEYYRQRVNVGQLALRFPGDLCEPGTVACSSAHFAAQLWHIDGCATDFVPGLTDHYGEIRNFNVLLGCLLSDVPEPLSGELCVYPGSHAELAAHFAEPGKLEDLRKRGHPAFPSKALFKRPVVHCTGRAGDLFLANYMTAHLIAPNTAPDVRYAVYFRVSGPLFDEHKEPGGTHPRSMLEPWVDWPLLNGSGALPAAPRPSLKSVCLSLAELHRQRELAAHHAAADYARLQVSPPAPPEGGQA